jgi:cytochrome c-type biogenesis protein CcmE
MLHRRFVYLGVGGVVLLVVALTLSGLNDNLTYYLYPTEAVAQRADFPDGETFRLAGTVVDGTVSESGDSITFDISDGGATIPVRLTESAPSLFGEGIPVLLEGSWDSERFVADDVLIRHSENYVTPEEGGAYPSG